MRIDIVGCKAGERVDCNDDGNVFAIRGDSVSVDCPAGCDLVTPYRVWGTEKYKLQSSVCQSAIHDGKIAGQNGGSVTIQYFPFSDHQFTGSTQHGIESSDADAEERAMGFGDGHLGCEDGWFQFRTSCYYIPRNSMNHAINWHDARGACQVQCLK